jgi:hypothetical protein
LPIGPKTPWRLRVFINAGRYGWSECYWLKAPDLDTALIWSEDFCNRRRLWFGLGVEMIYAQVSQGEACIDQWAVNIEQRNTFPPGLNQPGYLNDPQSCLFYILTRLPGEYKKRMFKGIPDEWLVGVVPTVPWLTPLYAPLPHVPLLPAADDQQAPLAPMSLMQLQVLQRSLLDALMLYTGTKVAGTPPGDQSKWTVKQYDHAYGPKYSTLPSKHAFRLLSWTGKMSHLHPTITEPDFSPCGVIMGAARTCYWQFTKFYGQPGVLPGIIRFYDAAPDANIYYGRNRFGPKISEPGYKNTVAAGELTNSPRKYTLGNTFPPLPAGALVSGDLEGFEGQAAYPPNYAIGVPIPGLPICDADATTPTPPAHDKLRLGWRVMVHVNTRMARPLLKLGWEVRVCGKTTCGHDELRMKLGWLVPNVSLGPCPFCGDGPLPFIEAYLPPSATLIDVNDVDVHGLYALHLVGPHVDPVAGGLQCLWSSNEFLFDLGAGPDVCRFDLYAEPGEWILYFFDVTTAAAIDFWVSGAITDFCAFPEFLSDALGGGDAIIGFNIEPMEPGLRLGWLATVPSNHPSAQSGLLLGWQATGTPNLHLSRWSLDLNWQTFSGPCLPGLPCSTFVGMDAPQEIGWTSAPWLNSGCTDCSNLTGPWTLQQEPLSPCSWIYTQTLTFCGAPANFEWQVQQSMGVWTATITDLSSGLYEQWQAASPVPSLPVTLAHVAGDMLGCTRPATITLHACRPHQPAQLGFSLGWKALVTGQTETAQAPRLHLGWIVSPDPDALPVAKFGLHLGWIVSPAPSALRNAEWGITLGWIAQGAPYTPGLHCGQYGGVTPANISVHMAGWANLACIDCANLDIVDVVPQIASPCSWTGASAATTCAGAIGYSWSIALVAGTFTAVITENTTGFSATYNGVLGGNTLPQVLTLGANTLAGCTPPATITLTAGP